MHCIFCVVKAPGIIDAGGNLSVGSVKVAADSDYAIATPENAYTWKGDSLRLWCGDGTWVLLPATPGLRDIC